MKPPGCVAQAGRFVAVVAGDGTGVTVVVAGRAVGAGTGASTRTVAVGAGGATVGCGGRGVAVGASEVATWVCSVSARPGSERGVTAAQAVPSTSTSVVTPSKNSLYLIVRILPTFAVDHITPFGLEKFPNQAESSQRRDSTNARDTTAQFRRIKNMHLGLRE
jgi:hypothetical protein